MPIVNFWVVKGNPRYPVSGVEERCGDIAYFLRDRSSEWITYRNVPPACKKGDPVFFWSSGKLRSIVALGRIKNPKIDGHAFEINHLSRSFFPPERQLGIEEIRSAFERKLSNAELALAGYIKPCVVATIYPVTQDQARILVRLLSKKNPNNVHLQEWEKLLASNAVTEGQSVRL